ncbi:MAG: hypothetical protein ABF479_18055, partial [Gluconacetobacter sp.]
IMWAFTWDNFLMSLKICNKNNLLCYFYGRHPLRQYPFPENECRSDAWCACLAYRSAVFHEWVKNSVGHGRAA